jgi:hypothetical protein
LHDEARIKNSDKAQFAKAPRDGPHPFVIDGGVGLTPASGSGAPSQR